MEESCHEKAHIKRGYSNIRVSSCYWLSWFHLSHPSKRVYTLRNCISKRNVHRPICSHGEEAEKCLLRYRAVFSAECFIAWPSVSDFLKRFYVKLFSLGVSEMYRPRTIYCIRCRQYVVRYQNLTVAFCDFSARTATMCTITLI